MAPQGVFLWENPLGVFTRRGYIELFRSDGTKVSQHVQETEVVESAIDEWNRSGEEFFTVTYPDKDIDLSSITKTILDTDVTRPNTPTGLNANPVSETQIDLTWNAATDPSGASGEAVSGVSGYRLYENGNLVIDQVGLTYSHTGLTAFTSYTYTVSSYDAQGNESLISGQALATTLDQTAPSVPVITASNTGSQTSLSVALTTPSTDSSSGVASYNLEYKATSSGTWLTWDATALAGEFPITVTGLVAGTSYDTRCSATDVSANTSAFSTTSSATTNSPSVGGENATRINAILDNYTIPARYNPGTIVEYPDDPVTTVTDEVTNQTELNTALSAGNGRLINVASGSYTDITITSGQTDLDIVLSNTASFSGQCLINSGVRIRITGGDFNYTGGATFVLQNSACNNIMIDNMNVANGFHLSNFTGGPDHIAIINSTNEGGGSFYSALCGQASHMILARNDFSAVSAAGVRGVIQNSLIVGNRISFTGANRTIRIHCDDGFPATLVGAIANQFEGDDNQNWWFGPEAGVDHSERITQLDFNDNTYYVPNSGVSGQVLQCDSSVNETSGGAGDGVEDVECHDNTFYTADVAPVTSPTPAGWNESGNTFNAYQSPPAYSFGADH